MTVEVVFDATLLTAATAFAGSSWLEWPSIPPVTHHAEQDCLAVVASAPRFDHDFGLMVSRELLAQVEVALAEDVGLRRRDIDDYLVGVLTLARGSGGGVATDPTTPTIGAGPFVDVPLRLAAGRRRLLVASHPELLDLGPRWGPDGVPIMSPRQFATRVDAARRA